MQQYILRGHPAMRRYARRRCNAEETPRIRLPRPPVFDPVVWTSPRVPPTATVLDADVYERFTFVSGKGRVIYRYYHKDHPEYYLLKTGKWNQWWQEKINRHINWRRGVGIGRRSYRRLVMAAMIRCVEDIN